MCKAITTNALFPQRLAAVAAATECRVIHMSTDAVFSGRSEKPYVETDATDPLDAYGKTKVLGESHAANVLNIRCSIIGRDPLRRKGLVEWVLGAPDGAELPGYDDHRWNGVSTIQFATVCRRILETGTFSRIRSTSAVYHFCPNPVITKFDLLCLIKQVSEKNVVIRRTVSAKAAGSRVLATCYGDLALLHPSMDWSPVIRQAIAGTPEFN
jgi:dTDP-4-dehydrorhamnose reductase